MQRLLWRHLVDAKKFEQGYLNLEEKNEDVGSRMCILRREKGANS